MTRRIVMLLLAAVSGGAPGIARSQGVQGITYAEQPTGIELRVYATTWPALEAYVGRLERWKWQRRTRDAYQRSCDLNPGHVSSRYYLAYTHRRRLGHG